MTNKKYQGYVTWITNKSGDYLDTEQTLNYKVNSINELLELIVLNGYDSYVNTIYSINDNGKYHMFNTVTDELTRLLVNLENKKLKENKKMKNNKKFMYVIELSENEQAQIKEDIKKALCNIPWINLENEVKNGMSRKLVDLEETIDINKYL